jgi:hypothetical protein
MGKPHNEELLRLYTIMKTKHEYVKWVTRKFMNIMGGNNINLVFFTNGEMKLIVEWN